jgi:hypothetical protein
LFVIYKIINYVGALLRARTTRVLRKLIWRALMCVLWLSFFSALNPPAHF